MSMLCLTLLGDCWLHASLSVLDGGMQDEIVPPSHMRALYEEVGGAANGNCTWVDFPDAHHNDTYEVAAARYWPAILAFFEKNVPVRE